MLSRVPLESGWALISTKSGPERQKFTIRTHEKFKAQRQREAIPNMIPYNLLLYRTSQWKSGERLKLAFATCLVC